MPLLEACNDTVHGIAPNRAIVGRFVTFVEKSCSVVPGADMYRFGGLLKVDWIEVSYVAVRGNPTDIML
jgi:hypothetical protein